MFEPVIKWSGSKRSQAFEILGYFPTEINTYYEPFCGGCSVLNRLMASDINVKPYICSDINSDLIGLWMSIKTSPNNVVQHYTELWERLTSFNNIEDKKNFFNCIRDRFNVNRDSLDFMFIMRTTTNGMPRYNKDGLFNGSYHVTRNGIRPNELSKIVMRWNYTLNKKDVVFTCCSYEDISPKNGDFIYLDPPYARTRGMYNGSIDLCKFFRWLGNVECRYALSFDGKVNSSDYTYSVPSNLYTKHVYLNSGNSSFRRILGKNPYSYVRESLYVK